MQQDRRASSLATAAAMAIVLAAFGADRASADNICKQVGEDRICAQIDHITDVSRPTLRARVTFRSSDPNADFYNVRVEGRAQFELECKGPCVFELNRGERKFLIQICASGAAFGSFCSGWMAFSDDIAPPPPPPPPPNANQPVDKGFVMKPTSRMNALKAQAGFAGIWNSITGDGVNYTLTLDAQGSGSVGAVNPKQDGTLQGTLSADGKQLVFVMTQPQVGITSRGQLTLASGGDTFTGNVTKDTEGKPTSFTGTRRK